VGHKELPVTHLRKVMLEELQRRKFSSATIRGYLGAVERREMPQCQIGERTVRGYVHERKLALGLGVQEIIPQSYDWVWRPKWTGTMPMPIWLESEPGSAAGLNLVVPPNG